MTSYNFVLRSNKSCRSRYFLWTHSRLSTAIIFNVGLKKKWNLPSPESYHRTFWFWFDTYNIRIYCLRHHRLHTIAWSGLILNLYMLNLFNPYGNCFTGVHFADMWVLQESLKSENVIYVIYTNIDVIHRKSFLGT